YPDGQENPLTNDEFEAFMKANDDKINNLKTEFDHFQKQCEQMQDDLLNQMRNFIQNFQNGPPGEDKEHEATTDTKLLSTEDIHPLAIQEPPRESDICQLIEECCVEVPEQQKHKMEKTMLDLVKICHHKQFLCIHDDVDDLIESALDSKLLSINSINSQHLDKKEQEVKIVKEQPAERRNHAEKSLQNFRVIHKSSISFNTSQISSIHKIAPILSTKEPEHSLIPDPAIVSVEGENVVQREEEEVDLEDISQVQDVVLREKLFSITRLISNIESLKDNSTPDRVLNSFESDNSLSLPKFETFCDHSEETRSGNTTHANYSLPEYDSFYFEIEPDQERLINLMKNDPDMIAEEISDKLNEDKYFDPGREINVSTKIEDDDHFPFMIVIRFFLPYFIFPEVSPLLLSAKSEDTIFDPEIILRQDKQSLTLNCGDTPSISQYKFESLNKVNLIDAGVSKSDSEEIENFLNDDSIPIGIENSVFDQEEDILYLESLLSEDPSPLPPMNPNQAKSSIEEPEHSFSIGYEHFNTTLVTKLDEVAESNIKNLVPIPSECKITLNESESNETVKDDSSAFKTFPNPLFNDKDDVTIHEDDVQIKESKVHSNPLFDNDEINSDELESHVESDSVESLSTHDALIDSSQNLEEISKPLMPIYIDKEARIRREHAEYIKIDIVTNTDELLPPGFNADDSDEEVNAVDDLHVDNSISNAENELSDNEESDFDKLSFPRPPPKPPNDEFDFEPDAGDEILVVMNAIDELECLNPRDAFDNDDYSFFIYSKVFSFLLSAESEDTIFDPGISV
nr:hypothetical protein [Tanacetum cinerariifolium]